jgi:hypothetical protein
MPAISVAAAETDAFMRKSAVRSKLITTGQALRMPGGPAVLFQASEGIFGPRVPYYGSVLSALGNGWPEFGQAAVVADLIAFGEYLADHQKPPWLPKEVASGPHMHSERDRLAVFNSRPPTLNQAAYLGTAALVAIIEETEMPARADRSLGPLHHLAPYLAGRRGQLGRQTQLPNLLVPEEFKQTFRDWAEGRVNFTA